LFTFGLPHHPLGVDQSSRFRVSQFVWIVGYNTCL